jgi:DDE_Tnp_1-associated
MGEEPVRSLVQHCEGLADARVERAKRHGLLWEVTIARCGVIGGAQSGVEIEPFGRAQVDWFQTVLDLPHGIASHDPFGGVVARRDAHAFEACLAEWMHARAGVLPTPVSALDGKTLRRWHERRVGRGALPLVSAWARANRLVLGQVAVDDTSNEITAIPLLLGQVALWGGIVPIDALGCQREIAQPIVAQGADDVLALTQNQPTLLEEVADRFALARASGFAAFAPPRRRLRPPASGPEGPRALRGARALGAGCWRTRPSWRIGPSPSPGPGCARSGWSMPSSASSAPARSSESSATTC